MPRVPDDILNCALHLYSSEEAAASGESRGGSGFVVSVFDSRADNRGIMYAVTAGHVVGQASVLRFNRTSSSPFSVRVPDGRWHRSETHDVAVAALHGLIGNDLDLFLMPVDLGLTRQRAVDDDLGHDGKERNTPTVRFGSVAMMPTEKIYNHLTGLFEESILIEVHSAAGYSGSPVFSYRENTFGSATRLLGLVWGHIDHRTMQNEDMIKQNSGIAAVVPSWAILDLVYEDEVTRERKRFLGPDTAVPDHNSAASTLAGQPRGITKV